MMSVWLILSQVLGLGRVVALVADSINSDEAGTGGGEMAGPHQHPLTLHPLDSHLGDGGDCAGEADGLQVSREVSRVVVRGRGERRLPSARFTAGLTDLLPVFQRKDEISVEPLYLIFKH